MQSSRLRSKISRISYDSLLQQLDALLVETKSLWQPEPFKTARPEWCDQYPELTRALLALDEDSVNLYGSDHSALITFSSAYLPALSAIPTLIELPGKEQRQHELIEPQLHAGIPGRKWSQIKSLYACIANPQLAITEWCGGKGYLGRLLSGRWQQPVTTLEYNRDLVDSGRKLAGKYNVDQQFKAVDVLNDPVSDYLKDHHPIALHACGDLHRELVKQIIETKTPSFTIVPCCYHLGRDREYRPFSSGLKLQLSREALRLAVNETVTANNREIEKRSREMAYQLGFQQLREAISGNADYISFNPVPKTWLKENFASYCKKLCAREGVPLPAKVEWERWQVRGEQRRFEVKRLQLLRQCFKRALELWLIMDMVAHFEDHGYSVNVSLFCERTLTPRNIVIEGKR